MAKQAQRQQLALNDGKMVMEQNTVLDDSLLPSADEIAKLNAVSPDILPWIMERTAIEQDARISFNRDRIKLARNGQNGTIVYDIIALILAFIVVLMFIASSLYLIIKGYTTAGSIFMGGTLVSVVAGFLKTKSNQSKK